MNALNNLATLDKNSTRGQSNQNFDIHHYAEDGKFTVSDELFLQLNLEDNGFKSHLNPELGLIFLSVHPNTDAVHYKGREGYDKGKVFTSSEMSKYFSQYNLEGELFITKEGEMDGVTYYRVSAEQPNMEETADTEEVETENTLETEVQ